MSQGTIKKVAGPLVIAEGMRDANMFDVVRVSENRLIGEIIENKIMEKTGTNNLSRGVEVDALDRSLKWDFVPVCKVGDELTNGDVIGTVKETAVVTQKIMVPYGISGTVKEIKAGSFSVDETVCILSTENGDKELTMMQKWPVRRRRSSRSSRDSALSTRSSRSQRAASPRSRDRSGPEKQSHSISLPSGRKRTSSSISAAASAEMR